MKFISIPGMVVHTFNLNIQKAEAEGYLWVSGQPYIARPSLKTNKQIACKKYVDCNGN